MITYLFEAFSGYFKNKWDGNEQPICNDDGTMTVHTLAWLECLGECSMDDITRGLRRLRTEGYRWPPGAIEYAELCLPDTAELGVPEVDEAYAQACRGDWTHGIVWYAARQIGIRTLRFDAERNTRGRYEREYTKLLRRAAKGERFVKTVVSHPMLEQQPPVPDGYERDRELLKRGVSPRTLLRFRIKKGRTEQRADHGRTRWAIAGGNNEQKQ